MSRFKSLFRGFMIEKWVSGVVLLFTFFLLRISIPSDRWRAIPESLCNASSGVDFSVPVMIRLHNFIFVAWQDLA